MWFNTSDPTDANRQMRLYLRNIIFAIFCLFGLSLLRAFTVRTSPQLTNKIPDLSGRFRRSLDTNNLDSNPMDGTFKTTDSPIPDFGVREPRKWAKDVFISVKTTQKFHRSRLQDILDTWYNLAPELIYFFSDAQDESLSPPLGEHLINTKCSASHSRHSLCCKMGVEYDAFIKSDKRWFCHFDDDNYVNVPQLMNTLARYDPRKDYYLGKPSTKGPIEIMDRKGDMSKKISFWFGTGGAGFCLSRSLAVKMQPFAGQGRFMQLGEEIRLPDDVTVGYIAEHLLNRKLTIITKLHSHLESMHSLNTETLKNQVSLSAGSYSGAPNVVPIPQTFPIEEDPNKFRSLHCFLYPNASICLNLNNNISNDFNLYDVYTSNNLRSNRLKR